VQEAEQVQYVIAQVEQELQVVVLDVIQAQLVVQEILQPLHPDKAITAVAAVAAALVVLVAAVALEEQAAQDLVVQNAENAAATADLAPVTLLQAAQVGI